MDPTRFDRLAIAVGQRVTRRTTVGSLAALGLTGLVRDEAAAVCGSPGAKCRRGAQCCSGLCSRKKLRCKCPQRVCCQCTGGDPVPCAFVSGGLSECSQRCANRGATGAQVKNPQPGTKTTICENTQCRQVDCVP